MSKRLGSFVYMVMVMSIVSSPAVWAGIIITPIESCRTDVREPGENKHDSSKLSVRSDEKSAKSWIKFDLGDLDVTSLDAATLTVTLHQEKSGNRRFDVSYVNDNFRGNIDWDERSLTWENAPGNDAGSLVSLDPGRTTLLGTVEFADGAPGDAMTIDVIEALETDTDGIVQFVLYNSNGLLNMATHDHAEEDWRPFLAVTEGAKGKAKKPFPAEGTTDVSLSPVLSWQPGAYVDGLSPMHRIFFSADFNDVNDGIGGVTQDASDYAPDSLLDFGKTYYWRVDEANGTSAWDIGDVWAFTTEPIATLIPGDNVSVTASSFKADSAPGKTIDGSGLDPETGTHSTLDTDMWVSSMGQDPNEPVSIMFEFDQTVKLHQMTVWNSNQGVENVVGYGFKDVIITVSTDGSDWTRLGGEDHLVRFDQAPGKAEYTGQSINLDSASARYIKLTPVSNWSQFFHQYSLSEVQFSAIPMAARLPEPGSGSENVDPRTAVLSWRPGRGAGRHDVFVSEDPDALGTAHSVMDNSLALDFLDLSLDTTYYWQVNEVNETSVPSTWIGDMWSFTTLSSFTVDDFESYSNLSPDRPFQSWIDGFGFTNPEPGNPGNNTGAAVGHDIWSLSSPHYNGSIMETGDTLPGSGQAMPVYYDNSGANGKSNDSQVDYAVGGHDWTTNGLQTLSIAFRGTVDNTGTLYAKINNTKISYDLDVTDIAAETWQLWTIDLASVTGDLTNVQTLSIGIDGAGASGVIYLDDIELQALPGE